MAVDIVFRYFSRVDEPIKFHNLIMAYNLLQNDWPDFKYDLSAVEDIVLAFAEKLGVVSGIIGTLPENIRSEAIKISEIEGAYLSRKDVMSSIKNNLGIHPRQAEGSDRRARQYEVSLGPR